MSQKAHTKDEKFMLALYEAALATEDLETSFDRYIIGAKIGLHPKAVDTICTLLLQANFIKKAGSQDIFITSRGEELVKSIMEEH